MHASKNNPLCTMLFALVFLLGMTAAAAAQPNGQTSKTEPVRKAAQASAKAVKRGAKATGKAVKAPAKAVKREARKLAEGRVLGSKEQLSGTLSFVNSKDNYFVVTGTDGVPYSFRATRQTRVLVDGKSATLKALPRYKQDRTAVAFMPMGRGNFAQTVTITG